MLHKTDTNWDAYESENGGNSYLWRIVDNVSAVVNEVPHGIESGFGHGSTLSFTSISSYNAWPEEANNASIFPYLNQDRIQEYPEFSAFIKNWHQSTCAIVYKNGAINKVVGSGILVTNTDIATARHNFNNIPCDNLYIRFFQYEVTNSSNPHYLCVRERHLDIPVISKNQANHGVDGGYLKIPSLQNTSVFKRYAKIISTDFNLFYSALPSGDYAMFHFSGGKPQVSVGKIHVSSFGSALHDNVFIQGGPGASGAGLICKSFNSVSALGISIYRFINAGNIQRRVIQFSQFKNGVFSDGISDPFLDNPSFKMIPVSAFNEDGYEFLRYRLDTHAGRRVDSPSDSAYDVSAHHSNHHIIPIADLLYLWDYFHTLDENTVYEIRRTINKMVIKFKQQKTKELNEDIRTFYRSESQQKWEDGMAQINRDAQNLEKLQFSELYRMKLLENYSIFYDILSTLCPNLMFDRTWFAWSFWNLFKGWKKSYRTDDTEDGCTLDFSEKKRPVSFTPTLWNCIKDDNEGLYRRIQQLKATATPNSANKTTMYYCLTTLAKEWEKRSHTRTKICTYRDSDWDLMGCKDGHDVYQVKP